MFDFCRSNIGVAKWKDLVSIWLKTTESISCDTRILVLMTELSDKGCLASFTDGLVLLLSNEKKTEWEMRVDERATFNSASRKYGFMSFVFSRIEHQKQLTLRHEAWFASRPQLRGQNASTKATGQNEKKQNPAR